MYISSGQTIDQFFLLFHKINSYKVITSIQLTTQKWQKPKHNTVYHSLKKLLLNPKVIDIKISPARALYMHMLNRTIKGYNGATCN